MEILILEWGNRMHPIIFQTANEYKGARGARGASCARGVRGARSVRGVRDTRDTNDVRQVQRMQGGNEVGKRGARKVQDR